MKAILSGVPGYQNIIGYRDFLIKVLGSSFFSRILFLRQLYTVFYNNVMGVVKKFRQTDIANNYSESVYRWNCYQGKSP
jgi:hypothetical protein